MMRIGCDQSPEILSASHGISNTKSINKNYLINCYLMVHQNQGLTGNEPHFPCFQISEIEIMFLLLQNLSMSR